MLFFNQTRYTILYLFLFSLLSTLHLGFFSNPPTFTRIRFRVINGVTPF